MHHAYRRRFPRGPSLGNLFGLGGCGLSRVRSGGLVERCGPHFPRGAPGRVAGVHAGFDEEMTISTGSPDSPWLASYDPDC